MKGELQNRIVGIVGRKGSGKSTVLREILSCRLRVVIFDTMAEHSSPNLFSSLDRCLDYLERVQSDSFFHCALRQKGDEEETLNELAACVYDVRKVCFALEEVPWFSTAASQPEGLDLLSRMGRHRRIDLVWTAQRMAEVSRRLTSATDIFVLFSITEPRDLTSLADRCGLEVVGRVEALGLHGKLIYDVLRSKIVSI